MKAALLALALLAACDAMHVQVDSQKVGRVTCSQDGRVVFRTDSLGWYDPPRIGTAFNEGRARAAWAFRKWLAPNHLGTVIEVSATALCVVEGADVE